MENLIIIRGGGDLATGVIYRLHQCGYRLLVLETEKPTSIRRMVSFSEAVYDLETVVEGVYCRRVWKHDEIEAAWKDGVIPLLVDSLAESVYRAKPRVLIDAIIAKSNFGTCRSMAPLTIALGPGFEAGFDVDYVIETKRGHDLGRILDQGTAVPNTGIPGKIEGFGAERVIHAPAAGKISNMARISDVVEKGDVLAMIGNTPVVASLDGVLRGIIRDGFEVTKGLKIADIDPRITEKKNCFTISDKARCIAGSVLEILLANGVYPV